MKKSGYGRGGSHRGERVGAAILRICASTLLDTISDPRLSDVSITAVEMSPDNRIANIHFSQMEGDADLKNTMKALKTTSGLFKRRIADELRLRHTPELIFYYDASLSRAAAMDRLLKSIAQNEGDVAKTKDENDHE